MLIFAAESSELAKILISEFLVLGIFMFVPHSAHLHLTKQEPRWPNPAPDYRNQHWSRVLKSDKRWKVPCLLKPVLYFPSLPGFAIGLSNFEYLSNFK